MAAFVESFLAMLWGILADFFALFTAEMVLSALLGALISFPVTLYFAWRSSKELREEAAELRRLNSILIFGVEAQGKFEVEIDPEGKIVSVHQVQINAAMSAPGGEMGLSSAEPDKD